MPASRPYVSATFAIALVLALASPVALASTSPSFSAFSSPPYAGCLDASQWTVWLGGAATAQCSADNTSLQLRAAARGQSCGNGQDNAMAEIVSRVNYTANVSVSIVAAGDDLNYASNAAFGWTSSPNVCHALWNFPNGVFVSTNAFGPENDRNKVGLWVNVNGQTTKRVVTVANESEWHVYTLSWKSDAVDLYVDGNLAAHIDGPTPTIAMPFVVQADAWATVGGPVTESIRAIAVTPGDIPHSAIQALLHELDTDLSATRLDVLDATSGHDARIRSTIDEVATDLGAARGDIEEVNESIARGNSLLDQVLGKLDGFRDSVEAGFAFIRQKIATINAKLDGVAAGIGRLEDSLGTSMDTEPLALALSTSSSPGMAPESIGVLVTLRGVPTSAELSASLDGLALNATFEERSEGSYRMTVHAASALRGDQIVLRAGIGAHEGAAGVWIGNAAITPGSRDSITNQTRTRDPQPVQTVLVNESWPVEGVNVTTPRVNQSVGHVAIEPRGDDTHIRVRLLDQEREVVLVGETLPPASVDLLDLPSMDLAALPGATARLFLAFNYDASASACLIRDESGCLIAPVDIGALRGSVGSAVSGTLVVTVSVAIEGVDPISQTLEIPLAGHIAGWAESVSDQPPDGTN